MPLKFFSSFLMQSSISGKKNNPRQHIICRQGRLTVVPPLFCGKKNKKTACELFREARIRKNKKGISKTGYATVCSIIPPHSDTYAYALISYPCNVRSRRRLLIAFRQRISQTHSLRPSISASTAADSL